MFPQYLLLPIIFLKIRSKRSFNHGGLKLPCLLAYFLKLFIYRSLYADIKINAIFFRSGYRYSPLSQMHNSGFLHYATIGYLFQSDM